MLKLTFLPAIVGYLCHNRLCFAFETEWCWCAEMRVQHHLNQCDLHKNKVIKHDSHNIWEACIPVCTKFVGCPIIDRSIRSLWCLLDGLGCCVMQHENNWIMTSPVEPAIFLLPGVFIIDGILASKKIQFVRVKIALKCMWLILSQSVSLCVFLFV